MAIARSGSASTGTATGFSLSITHDSGSSTGRYMVVALHHPNDTISSVTYNAVPLTLVGISSVNPFISIYVLPSPTVGSNVLTVSNANFNFMQAVVQVYTDVDASTTPDSLSASTDNATFATSLTMSTTTVEDNAWTFYGVYCARTDSAAVAGTGSTLVGQLLHAAQGSVNLFEGGPHTPAGAESMQATHGSATNWRAVMFSLAPASGGGGGGTADPNNLLLLCG